MLILIVWSMVTAGILGAIIGRAYERNRWQERVIRRAGLVPDEPKRLMDAIGSVRDAASPTPAQLADAIDAIAIEVERIGEGQRFLTKLLADRTSRTSGNRTPSPIPGAIRSPIPPTA